MKKNNFDEEGFTITAHILTQNRTLSAYDYEIARKITRGEANMMVKKKHKFAVGEVVKKRDYDKFFTIHFVKFNKDLKLEYYLRDDQNLDKHISPVTKFNGNYGWMPEDELRKITKEEQEEYTMKQQTDKYNL